MSDVRIKCRICGNDAGNATFTAREMMFGTREVFEYLDCSKCGTLQLISDVDLSKYYPSDYYSLDTAAPADAAVNFLRRQAAPLIGKYLLTGKGIAGRWLTENKPEISGLLHPSLLDPILELRFDSRILDYGSGGGRMLRNLHYFGFRDLTGADPFLAEDIVTDEGVKLFRASLDEIDRKYDLIMLHHSFEHIPEPKPVLDAIRQRLTGNGKCLIRMPVKGYVWERYGADWVQLDPPRHVNIFSIRGFTQLCEESGFRVEKVVYDSDAFQFFGSEQYKKDIPLDHDGAFDGRPAKGLFTKEELDQWQADAARLNEECRGDQACFYLSPV